MRATVVLNSIASLLLFGVFALPAQAEQMYEVAYHIHDDPNDAESNVVFTTMLFLKASEFDGDSIGWQVNSIRIQHFDPNQNVDEVWSENSPDVDTADGLWWVEHNDPNNPLLEDFGEPPPVAGTAENQQPNQRDMYYSIEGNAPPGSTPYTITGTLAYNFEPSDQAQPIRNGLDDPTEVLDDDDGIAEE